MKDEHTEGLEELIEVEQEYIEAYNAMGYAMRKDYEEIRGEE